MRVADKADLVEALKDADELARIGVNVVGKNVFIDRPARRGVNADHLPLLEANWQVTEVFPAPSPANRIGIGFEAISGPKTGLFRAAVEVKRLVKHRKVVVAHQRNPTAVGHDVQALHRIGSIANDIAQANDIGDAAAVDLGKDGV